MAWLFKLRIHRQFFASGCGYRQGIAPLIFGVFVVSFHPFNQIEIEIIVTGKSFHWIVAPDGDHLENGGRYRLALTIQVSILFVIFVPFDGFPFQIIKPVAEAAGLFGFLLPFFVLLFILCLFYLSLNSLIHLYQDFCIQYPI